MRATEIAFKADRLRAVREAKGWRPAALARAAETPESQISRYEKGQRVPTANVIAKLAQALEVSTDYLLGIDNRLEGLGARAAVSSLTLEWHLRESPATDVEFGRLLRIARESPTAPVTVAGWLTIRSALEIVMAPGATEVVRGRAQGRIGRGAGRRISAQTPR